MSETKLEQATTVAKLLRAMAKGTQYKESRHDVIFDKAASLLVELSSNPGEGSGGLRSELSSRPSTHDRGEEKRLADDLERILTRRIWEHKLDGYTLETAEELARVAIRSLVSPGKDL